MATFDLLPAIDLRGGRVVRLRQGDFARETAYSQDPVAVAGEFASRGARWLHVVDLDGARAGRPTQIETVRRVVAAAGEGTAVEVAGGLRTAADIAAALDGGAARAVVGTAALADPEFAAGLIVEHGPDRIAVALDVRDGLAVGQAWVPGADGVPLGRALEGLAAVGVRWFEVTAIERDGTLEGPDLSLLKSLTDAHGVRIVASGGIGSLDDLRAVREIGCAGAIVGRALYDGTLDLEAALVVASA